MYAAVESNHAVPKKFALQANALSEGPISACRRVTITVSIQFNGLYPGDSHGRERPGYCFALLSGQGEV